MVTEHPGVLYLWRMVNLHRQIIAQLPLPMEIQVIIASDLGWTESEWTMSDTFGLMMASSQASASRASRLGCVLHGLESAGRFGDDEIAVQAAGRTRLTADLEMASDRLRNTECVAMTYVHTRPSNYEFVSDNLREKSRELAMLAVRTNGRMLKHVPLQMRDDKEIVLSAVRQNAAVFEYVSERLQLDIHVRLAAFADWPKRYMFNL